MFSKIRRNARFMSRDDAMLQVTQDQDSFSLGQKECNIKDLRKKNKRETG